MDPPNKKSSQPRRFSLQALGLDRLLHHADTVIIEGKSYRMKDQIEAP